ncbi:phospholipase D-like domain-containing protein [Nocardioides KLBMP 9356]|uniref:phospholipase D n=1 Tax=Nocardioides potassii TaxID=2911371 RepID=A0ABS9HHV7_9ACTN|nr:phospholipase D-like domain-containing protein [Nocardioides potassii]MCF6379906.1 phospholipase D-like domain-containing protein [Nocardioides potassii]
MSRFPILALVSSLALGAALAGGPTASAVQGAPSAATQQVSLTTVAEKPAAKKQAPKPPKGWRKWEAPRGPFFNDPHLPKGHFNIEKKVVQTINHTPKGSYIRIAVYSFDRVNVARAIIAAHRRGVKVQMLLNDHWDTPAMKMIRNEIGTNRKAKSFIYKCKASCRSAANEFNNLHSKLYLFSQAGTSTDVVATGSANMTRNADIHQWNDLYFMSGDHELFRQFVALFNDMKVDYNTRQDPLFFCGVPRGAVCDDSVDKHTVWAFPRVSGPKNDLVLDTLAKVQCLTPDAEGNVVRTKLALSMHTMRGNRGNYLAEAIRKKWAQGCDVRVMFGLIGYHTKGVIAAPTARGRIPLRSTGMDYNTEDNFDLNNDGEDDLILDYYSHQKYLVVQGTYNGVQGTNMVITGSSNWASLSTANDEIWFTIQGAKVAKKYVNNFDYQWNNKRNSRDAYTTTYANFRVKRDGRWVTERREVTTLTPENYATGPYWEAD